MHCLAKIYKITKNQSDLWFFYGFLFTFTLNIRKVLFFYPIQKEFNEYTGIYLYLSDIFLFLTLFFWILSILYNKYILLSIKNTSLTSSCKAIKKLFSKWHFSISLLIVIWSFLSTTWAQNQSIALFRSIKLFELYLVYTYIIHKISTSKSKNSNTSFVKDLFKVIIATGIFQSIIAMGQFVIQHSIGLFWLKESLISPNIPGVAKFIFNGDKYIRAYGLFPHPNILGGFLLFSILLTYYYPKLFHACPSIVPRLPAIVPRLPARWVGGTIWNAILTLQFIALFLTFSKSAIIGLILSFLYIKIHNSKHETLKVAPRLPAEWVGGTILKFTIIAILAVVLFIFTKIDTNSFFLKSLNERVEYLNVSRGTILDNPIMGLGSGQFVLSMQDYTSDKLQTWQFQTVHNVFLLIWSELGLVGLGLFVVFLWKLFHVEHFETQDIKYCSTPARQVGGWNNLKYRLSNIVPRLPVNVPRGTFLPYQHQKYLLNTLSKAIILGFIFIMLFDHYLWDIHQGQIILWITLGLVAGTSQKTEKEPVR